MSSYFLNHFSYYRNNNADDGKTHEERKAPRFYPVDKKFTMKSEIGNSYDE